MVKKIGFVFMILLLVFSTTACSISREETAKQLLPAYKEITDAAGRTVIVPAKINTVYSVSPVGTIFMYTLAPDKIAGRNWEAADSEKKYTLASYSNLPVIGGAFGKDKTMNPEEVLKVKPDIILQTGIDDTSVSTADTLQNQLNIPVIVVRLGLDNIDQTYEFMGKLLGVEEQAQQLAEYCRQTMADVKAKAAAIPADKQVRVYYAEGNEGLETDPKDSQHTEVLDLVKGLNIADVAIQNGYGRSQVSIEQILFWNPEVIIVCFDQDFQSLKNGAYQVIANDAKWQQVQAVQQKRVYQIPYAPFNWFDRPPSVNRIIGIKWLANLLYPDYFKYDMKQETKEFYKKFYHVELTNQDVEDILQHAR